MELYVNVIGSGKPFLILHGFLGMGDNWKTLGKRFSKLGFEVHLIDQRNHGRSPHSDDFSYELMAKDLKKYCVDNDLKNIILMGHSMGGKVAMLASTLYPDLIEKLIIVDIAPKYYAPHHQDILNGLTYISEQTLTSRKDADTMLSNYVNEFSVRQFLLKNLHRDKSKNLKLRMNLEGLKNNIDQVGRELPEENTFNGETLFIDGEKSNYIQDSDESKIKHHFPNSKIEPVKGAGHWVHAEKHEEFYDLVSDFIQ